MSGTKTECGECFGTGYYRGLGPDGCPDGCAEPGNIVESNSVTITIRGCAPPEDPITVWVVPGAIGRCDDPTAIVRVLKIKGIPDDCIVEYEYLNRNGSVEDKSEWDLDRFLRWFTPDPDWVAK